MKRMIVIAALVAVPGMASAQMSCSEKHAAQSCAEGTMWDSATQSCKELVSS